MAEDTVKARQDSFNSPLKRPEQEVSKVETHMRERWEKWIWTTTKLTSRPGHRAAQHYAGWCVLLPAGCGRHDSEPPGLVSQRREVAAASCRSLGSAVRHAWTHHRLVPSYAVQQNLPLPLREQAQPDIEINMWWREICVLWDQAALCSTDIPCVAS